MNNVFNNNIKFKTHMKLYTKHNKQITNKCKWNVIKNSKKYYYKFQTHNKNASQINTSIVSSSSNKLSINTSIGLKKKNGIVNNVGKKMFKYETLKWVTYDLLHSSNRKKRKIFFNWLIKEDDYISFLNSYKYSLNINNSFFLYMVRKHKKSLLNIYNKILSLRLHSYNTEINRKIKRRLFRKMRKRNKRAKRRKKLLLPRTSFLNKWRIFLSSPKALELKKIKRKNRDKKRKYKFKYIKTHKYKRRKYRKIRRKKKKKRNRLYKKGRKKKDTINQHNKISKISKIWNKKAFEYLDINKNKLSEFAKKSLYFAIYKRIFLVNNNNRKKIPDANKLRSSLKSLLKNNFRHRKNYRLKLKYYRLKIKERKKREKELIKIKKIEMKKGMKIKINHLKCLFRHSKKSRNKIKLKKYDLADKLKNYYNKSYKKIMKKLNFIIRKKNQNNLYTLLNRYRDRRWLRDKYVLGKKNKSRHIYKEIQKELLFKSFIFSEWLINILNYWFYNYLSFRITAYFLLGKKINRSIFLIDSFMDSNNNIITVMRNKIKQLIISKSKQIRLFDKIKKRKHKLYSWKKTLPWINRYCTAMLFKNLRLKIIQTLESNLKCNIIFSCGYLKKYVPPINNVKMFVNYIKLIMQRGRNKKKIPYVMKKLGYLHLANRVRRIKCRKRINKKVKRTINNLSSFFSRYKFHFLNKMGNMVNVKKYLNLKALRENNKYFKYTELLYATCTNEIRKQEKKKIYLLSKWYKAKAIKNMAWRWKTNRLIRRMKNTKRLVNVTKGLNITPYTISNKINTFTSSDDKYTIKHNLFDSLNSYATLHLSESFYNFRTKFFSISKHIFPIGGMRIEISGPAKKGRRRRINFYRSWVPYASLLGKASGCYVSLDVVYWQTFCRLPMASLGLKVWITFRTPSYKRNRYRFDKS